MKIKVSTLQRMIREAVEEAMATQALDPVGKEDEDVNNDGKVDDTDDYLLNRREKIGSAIQKKQKESARRRGHILKEDVMSIASAASDVVYKSGDAYRKLFKLFSDFSDSDLKDFVSLPSQEGMGLMVQAGIDPAEAKEAWLKAWKVASVIAHPEDY